MLKNFIKELRGKPRLRWGLATIVGVLWLYAVLLLRDGLQEQVQKLDMTAKSIARLKAQLAQPEWLARMEQVKVLSVQMEGRLWQAPTAGLAQAAFQDWINSALVKAVATNPQMTVTVIDEAVKTPVATQDAGKGVTPAGLWKIKAKLGFNFTPEALMSFLNLVESNDHQIIVGTLDVRREPLPHVEMELYGYFQKQADPTGEARNSVTF